MTKILYQLFVRLYPFIIRVASPFDQKAKFWIKGREAIFSKLRASIKKDDKIIWMHCSSLGEFEQGRPVLEKIKSNYFSYKILLTFFSPSGYEVRKNYEGADHIFYLPNDSKKNAISFFDIVNPQLVIFVKYEFWYYYLNEAKKRDVPLLLVSAIFRQNQPFFSKYGNFHREMLSCFSHLFVQNEKSIQLLASVGFSKNVSLSGDTRFDRVIEIAEKFEPISIIEKFCSDSNVIVAGSTWIEDDKVLAHFVNTKRDVKFIIAPHHIGKERLDELMKLFKYSILYSSLATETPSSKINAIIIDNIGMLSRLYKYATIGFVGGGFGADGVHNVLEAAVYGIPVVYGPRYKKFNEAIELIESAGGISIENAIQLEATFNNLLSNRSDYATRSAASLNYVYSMRGATDKILEFLHEKRLLIN